MCKRIKYIFFKITDYCKVPIDWVKDMIFKIKDYDRLESDYSRCLYYFTNGRLSKTGYKIDELETLICDTIGEYMDDGERNAKEEIIKLIESRLSELLGDAQPTPILRYELMDLVKKIKEED